MFGLVGPRSDLLWYIFRTCPWNVTIEDCKSDVWTLGLMLFVKNNAGFYFLVTRQNIYVKCHHEEIINAEIDRSRIFLSNHWPKSHHYFFFQRPVS